MLIKYVWNIKTNFVSLLLHHVFLPSHVCYRFGQLSGLCVIAEWRKWRRIKSVTMQIDVTDSRKKSSQIKHGSKGSGNKSYKYFNIFKINCFVRLVIYINIVWSFMSFHKSFALKVTRIMIICSWFIVDEEGKVISNF